MERNDTHITIVEISEVELREILLKYIGNEHPDLRILTKPRIEYFNEHGDPIEPGFKCIFTFSNGTKKKRL